MSKYMRCKKCHRTYEVFLIPSEEFSITDNEKFCYPIMIHDDIYYHFFCDKCESVNIAK